MAVTKLVNPWSDRLVRGKPAFEDQSRNGVKVIVRRNENGSVVEADCQCFGGKGRLHSNPYCPLLRSR
jgi:hypothetical protein